MRLGETLRGLVRRWYIVLLGLVLTAGMCWVVYDRVPVTYEATGSLVLMPPSATVGEEGNPYLYLGGMSQALDVLIRRVSAVEVVEPVLTKFPQTGYTIEADHSTSGAIVLVSASAPSREATLEVLHAALDTVPVALRGMQDELSIAEYLRINLMTVVVDGDAAPNSKMQLQLLVVAAGGGIVGTVLLTGMIDGLLLARTTGRTPRDKSGRSGGHSAGGHSAAGPGHSAGAGPAPDPALDQDPAPAPAASPVPPGRRRAAPARPAGTDAAQGAAGQVKVAAGRRGASVR